MDAAQAKQAVSDLRASQPSFEPPDAACANTLLDRSDAVNQGYYGTCGMAAIVRSYLQHDRARFVELLRAVYAGTPFNGIATGQGVLLDQRLIQRDNKAAQNPGYVPLFNLDFVLARSLRKLLKIRSPKMYEAQTLFSEEISRLFNAKAALPRRVHARRRARHHAGRGDARRRPQFRPARQGLAAGTGRGLHRRPPHHADPPADAGQPLGPDVPGRRPRARPAGPENGHEPAAGRGRRPQQRVGVPRPGRPRPGLRRAEDAPAERRRRAQRDNHAGQAHRPAGCRRCGEQRAGGPEVVRLRAHPQLRRLGGREPRPGEAYLREPPTPPTPIWGRAEPEGEHIIALNGPIGREAGAFVLPVWTWGNAFEVRIPEAHLAGYLPTFVHGQISD
jgi:hypothetical protein